MPLIATNIYKNLSTEDKEAIKNFDSRVGEIETYEYIQKAAGLENIVKFVFNDFNITGLIRDGIIWDIIKQLITKLITISQEKYTEGKEFQIWIEDHQDDNAINIAFSVRSKEELSDLFSTLQSAFEESRKKKIKGKEIIWIAYDKEQGKWNIQVF